VVEPLLRPVYLGVPIELGDARSLVVTSRHALEALARQPSVLAAARALSVEAVGPATAAQAHALGLLRVRTGPGTAEALAGRIIADGATDASPYLHLSGEDVAMDLVGRLAAAGIEARRLIVYRMVAADRLTDAARIAIESGGLGAVVLMSPRTARIYARLVDAAGLRDFVRPIRHACLSAAVAGALDPLGRVDIRISPRPSLDGLLTLLS
jgi:uroporphyrinogen-III synthase